MSHRVANQVPANFAVAVTLCARNCTPYLPPTGARAIRVVTLAIPDPDESPSRRPTEATRVNTSLSYTRYSDDNILTLSTNGVNSGDDISGLLYTPNLAEDDACFNTSRTYVPANATRLSNFPDTERLSLVALAPWISPSCTLSYLTSARNDGTQAFLFWKPDNRTEERDLDLYDGGNWKRENNYPVYVLSTAMGNELINATADYSGNLSSVPNSEELLNDHDPDDYVRLYIDVDTGTSSSGFTGTFT